MSHTSGLPVGKGGRLAALRQFTPEQLATPQMVPVVVQFQQPPVAVYQAQNPELSAKEVSAYADQLRTRHRQFVDSLKATGLDARISRSKVLVATPDGVREEEVEHDFTYCFNGVGLLLTGTVVQHVAGVPDVEVITLDEERTYINLGGSVPFTGAPKAWEMQAADGRPLLGHGITIAVIDTGMLVL